jgi:hypothetical protein
MALNTYTLGSSERPTAKRNVVLSPGCRQKNGLIYGHLPAVEEG